MKGTGKGYGSSADWVMCRVIGIHVNCKGRGSWDGIIGMKGISKGCGSSRDEVIGCSQKDKVYQQRVWFLWVWGNRVWSDWSKCTDEGCCSSDRVIGIEGTSSVWFFWGWGNRVWSEG